MIMMLAVILACLLAVSAVSAADNATDDAAGEDVICADEMDDEAVSADNDIQYGGDDDNSLGSGMEPQPRENVNFSCIVGEDNQGKYIDISLKDSQNNSLKMVKIKVTVGDKSYSSLLGSSGILRAYLIVRTPGVEIPEVEEESNYTYVIVSADTYSVDVVFNGNMNYENASQTVIVNMAGNSNSSSQPGNGAVNPTQTSPQSGSQNTAVSFAKTTLTLKAVKVKKSAKKLILLATLKQGNTPLKAKKITFKFNGKKYTAKTNAKGIAKVTVKSKVLKKLKVGKKVKIEVSYGKTISKTTVKVQK